MASEKDQLTSRIILRAVLPVIKVLLEEDPKTAARFKDVTAAIQFTAHDPESPMAAHIMFDQGEFSMAMGTAEHPDMSFRFSSLARMNAFFAGKPVLPGIAGFTKIRLLLKVVGILLALKMLMPDAKPKSADQAYLKVKMTLYMVSTALSQLNKAGDSDMAKWTAKQPERIYQWSVDGTDIACYLRVKAGKSKAGRGVYPRRKPFVHMRFSSVDAALPVLANEVGTVQAMTSNLLEVEGSPEYAGKLGDFMLKISGLVTG